MVDFKGEEILRKYLLTQNNIVQVTVLTALVDVGVVVALEVGVVVAEGVDVVEVVAVAEAVATSPQ